MAAVSVMGASWWTTKPMLRDLLASLRILMTMHQPMQSQKAFADMVVNIGSTGSAVMHAFAGASFCS